MILIVLLLLSVLFIILSVTRLRLHPFLALLFAAIGFGISAGMPLPKIAASVNEGFGDTIGNIGIVICAGTIIGTFLERSGGALALARRILDLIGKERVPAAMGLVGYIVSIPVFSDSGFVILQPLNKALTKRAGTTLAASAIALALGLTASHAIVPPTPGPIYAALKLRADLGLVILLGIPISFLALLAGWVFALRWASRVWIDPEPELQEAELQARLREAPPPFMAAAPILLPLLLIVGRSIAQLPAEPLGSGWLRDGIRFLGEPVIALLLGVLLAFTLPPRFDRAMLSDKGWVGRALLNAAIIILITGAGGAFGKVLQNSGIADAIGRSLSGARLGIWLPFFIAAALKTAQGSSTVAIITTASLLEPMMGSLGLDAPPARAVVVLAIGAGSMVVSHANDSFFWVVTQMSGMDVKTGYALQTTGTLVLGTAAGLATWVLGLLIL